MAISHDRLTSRVHRNVEYEVEPMSGERNDIVVSERRRVDRPVKHNRRADRAATSQEVHAGPEGQSLLTDCTIKYAAAVHDPFNTSVGACVPDVDVRTSFRTKCWARGVMSTGTNGFGFIALNPYAGLASDFACCSYTVANIPENKIVTTIDGISVLGLPMNSLFESTAFSPTIAGKRLAFRPVAWGLRMRPITAELELAGVCAGITIGNAANAEDLQWTDLMGQQEVEPIAVASTREWTTVTGTGSMLFGIDAGNYASSLKDAGISDAGRVVTYLMCEGCPEADFEFEIVAHYEIDGEIPGKLPSHCDPIGQSAVDALTAPPRARAARNRRDGTHEAKGFVSDVCDYVLDGISGLAKWAAPKVKTAAKDAALGSLLLLMA